MGGRIPGRTVLREVPPPRRLPPITAAGLLHRRPCRHRGPDAAQPGREALSQLLPDPPHHRAVDSPSLRRRRGRGPTRPGRRSLS
ncbi:MAG: hypothetical protein MZV64_42870 [Ignavibacteriales bacterium]|nr:hypothetical protein [Ignavibacteriales bacterium]